MTLDVALAVTCRPLPDAEATNHKAVAIRLAGSATAHTSWLYQLHVLRAFAVVLVVMDHSCLAVSQRIPIADVWIHLAWLAGFLGVTIFFVISGFIMVQTTRRHTGSVSGSLAFLGRRIERIVPMYYLATLTAIAIALFTGSTSLHNFDPTYFICSFLFIPAMNKRHLMEPFLAQGWTLNYEMCFYALFACSLCLDHRKRSIILAAALSIAVVANSFWTYEPGSPNALQYLAAPIVLNFAVGMLIAECLRPRLTKRSFWQPLALSGALTGLLMVAALAAGAQGATGVIVFGWQLAVVVYATSAACCWLCISYSSPLPPPGIPRVLARSGVLLGDASYMTYLFHTFIVSVLTRVIVPAGLGFFVSFLSCAVGAVAACVVLHLVVERRVQAIIKRRQPGRAAKAVPGGSGRAQA